MQRTAFTLIELLVVIALIGLFVGLLWPVAFPRARDPMEVAIFNGDLAECKRIVEEGKTKPEKYPEYLQRAASYQHLDIVQYFVEDLKTPVSDKELFVYTVWGGYSSGKGDEREIIDYLLEKGVPVDATVATKSENWTLLHAAALNGYVDIGKTALEKGADKEAINDNRQTPLQMAAEHGHAEFFHLLLDSGAKFDVKAKGGYREKTLLHFAAAGGNGEICKFLLEQGADLNAKDNEGAQPIHDAAGAESPDACRVLMDAGADINVMYFTTSLGFTPIDSALYHGRTKNFLLLYQAGAKYDLYKKQIGSYYGANVLRISASEGDVELAQFLVEKGMDIRQNDHGMSLLYFAAGKNQTEFCRWLIQNGLEVNAKNSNGDTPLHAAASRNDVETCRVLLEAGADPQLKNNLGVSPIDLAKSYQPWNAKEPDNKELLELLKNGSGVR